MYDLAWSPDSSQIIVGSTDNSASVWSVKAGISSPLSSLFHLPPLLFPLFSFFSLYIYILLITIYNPCTHSFAAQCKHHFEHHNHYVQGVAWDPLVCILPLLFSPFFHSSLFSSCIIFLSLFFFPVRVCIF